MSYTTNLRRSVIPISIVFLSNDSKDAAPSDDDGKADTILTSINSREAIDIS
ncbi:MAG: hypothetical protein HKL83_02220 [Acidimicrobiaceae bacterium]|nr:hypothetical protein [Acidimicrobiaceae bacterium]